MSDRKALIRLASSMPSGDPARRAILSSLQKRGAHMWWWQEEAIKNALGADWGYGSVPYHKFFKSLDKKERLRLPKNNERAWLKAMAKLIVDSGAEADERTAVRNLGDFFEVLREEGYMAYDEPENNLNEPLTDAGLDELVLMAVQEVNKL